MAEEYFMGLDGFIWFVGVVEDRNDPDELGRVQVRCLGYHTENLTLIPTEDLPWAHLMHPVTDPSMQGLGNTPSFLVEGTWVVGFFLDAKDKQQPVIMGTLPGYPQSTSDTTKGFNDPTGTYPSEKRSNSDHGLKESDVSRLARGKDSEDHESLKGRRDWWQDKIPTATAPYNDKTDNTQQGKEKRKTWDEPHPRGHESDESPYPSAKYPYNHVHESEAGHIHEIDDTPGGERLMQQHSSGTFTEIIPDGTKVVKVLGDNYEMIVGESNILVIGDANITYDNNVRQLVRGDYILEVEGDYSEKIHKNKRMKVGSSGVGNLTEEVRGNYSYNIDRGVEGRIGQAINTNIGGDESRIHGGGFKMSSLEGITLNSAFKSILLSAQEDIALETGIGSIDITATKTASIAGAANTNIGGLLVSIGDTTTTSISLSSSISVAVISATFNVGLSAITAAQAVLASQVRPATPCITNITGATFIKGATSITGAASVLGATILIGTLNHDGKYTGMPHTGIT